MDIVLAIILAASLLFATASIHYGLLRATAWWMPHPRLGARHRILVTISGIFVAHLIEISLYALAYYLMHAHLNLGAITGEFRADALDFFYFSITCYTTLGVGDLIPQGALSTALF